MCELMALCFAEPSGPGGLIDAFGARGEANADGWGLAWYPDGRAAAVAKEPVKWGASPLARFLCGGAGLQSRVFVAHVRDGTTGDGPCQSDTHPFARERAGRDYVFAHNGTLKDPVWSLTTGRYTPLGQTDSERAFCHLLSRLDDRGGHLDDDGAWCWLHGVLIDLNALGKLNVLMSDGRRVFAYHDLGGWKGLSFRCRGEGVAVATRPLDRGDWLPFPRGGMIVVEAGVVDYMNDGPRP